MKIHILIYIIFLLVGASFQIQKQKRSVTKFFSMLNNIKKNKKIIRIFKLVFKNCGIFFLWIPLWIFVQMGFYRAVVFLSKNFSLGNKNIYPILPAIICFSLQPLILMCVISQFKRKLEKKKFIFITGIIQGVIHYLPQYIILIKKKCFFSLDIYSQIYFVLDKEEDNSQEKRARILEDRMALYAVDDILAILEVLIYIFQFLVGPIIYWTWYLSEPLMVIMKYMLIAILAALYSIEIFGFLYTCYLYLWNKKWEETYEDVLSEGKVAPNIETVEFPKLLICFGDFKIAKG